MKRIFLFIALIGIGLSSCQKDNEPKPNIPEITVGDNDEAVITLDKGNSLDKKLNGGNGKFTATVQDSRVVEAKIDGNYLKLRGLSYGETTISLRSHDKKKSITVRVERPAISLPQSSVTLLPGENRKDITVRGGGDDATYEVIDPEGAIEARWEATTGVLDLVAKHEGEAKIVFKTNDDKPQQELVVVVKASNDVTKSIGFYPTTSSELRLGFPLLLHAHRPGKMVWLSSSTDIADRSKKKIYIPSVKSPQRGAKLSSHVTFVEVRGLETGEYKFIVEEVHEAEGLATLRAPGFKLVVPYDK